MLDWLKDLFAGGETGTPEHQLATQIYAKTVRQARQPVFYRDLGVADSVPGRFEMIALHMFVLLDRLTRSERLTGPDQLSNKDEVSHKVAQQLVDVMFQDMDDVARETGVGDMGVGPRIKKLARSFQSRLEYYKEAIEGDERGTLPEAILEVFHEDDKEQMPKAEQLAAYVMKEQSRLADMSVDEMAQAQELFGALEVRQVEG